MNGHSYTPQYRVPADHVLCGPVTPEQRAALAPVTVCEVMTSRGLCVVVTEQGLQEFEKQQEMTG